MKRLALLFLLTACGAAGTEKTRPAEVRVYNVIGEGSLTRAEFEAHSDYALRPFLRIGADMRISYQREVDPSFMQNVPASLYGLEYQEGRLWMFASWVRRNAKMKWGSIYYGMFPPIQHQGQRLFGGMALRICGVGQPQTSIVIGQAGAWSSHQPPRDRIWSSLGIVMAHEAGHQLGADHLDGENLMDPAAGRFADSHYQNLWFADESIEQMSACVTVVKVSRIVRCLDRKRPNRCMRRAGRWIAMDAGGVDVLPEFQ